MIKNLELRLLVVLILSVIKFELAQMNMDKTAFNHAIFQPRLA